MEGALFKWLDNSTLLIAAPETGRLDTTLNEFNGVRLIYEHYPSYPEVPGPIGSHNIFTKLVDFTYRFTNGSQEGQPLTACYLHMTAKDGDYLNELSFTVANHGIIRSSEEKAIKPLTYKTSMEVQDFSPIDPSISKYAIIPFIHDIEKGNLQVKYGFWFDNAEVIYTSSIPKDVSALKAFERCISENQIYSTIKTEK